MTTAVTASPAVQTVMDATSAALAGALPDVAVLDASDLTQVYASSSVTIGGAWDPDTGAMSATDAITVEASESGAGRLLVETTHISCVAYAGSGGTDLSADRVTVNAILSAVRDAIRSITDVEGAAARAEMVAQQWAQIVDEQGSGVVATFEVTVVVLP